MAAAPSAPAPPRAMDATAGPSLRTWGLVVFVMFVLTSVAGSSLATESSYLLVTLGSHIGLALVTLALAGYSARVVGRTYRILPQAAAGLAALGGLGATIAGTAFLVGGQSSAALYAMEGFAVLGILAAIVMIVVGGPSGKNSLTAFPKAGST
jgi:hypothetical protein